MLGILFLMLGLWKNVKYLNAKTFFPTLLGIVDTFIFSVDTFNRPVSVPALPAFPAILPELPPMP